MLPTHGGYGRRRGSQARVAVTAGAAVLLLVAVWCGWSLVSTKKRASALQKDVDSFRRLYQQAEDQLQHERMVYQNLQHEYHAAQRSLQDATRNLHSREQELHHKEQSIQQHSYEKDHLIGREGELQRTINELRDQINYEKAVHEALKQKLQEMDSSHTSREKDWHDLAAKWKKYEQDTIAENLRLQQELAKAQHQPPPNVTEQALPPEEPGQRPESVFNAQVHLPREEDFVHHHPASPLPPQQQQQQHVDPHFQHHPPPPLVQQQQQNNAPSPPEMRHHQDIYMGDFDHHDNHHWNPHYEEHLDPLDQYWVNDDFRPEHDNFHGDHWQAPPHHDDHWNDHHGNEWHHDGHHVDHHWEEPDWDAHTHDNHWDHGYHAPDGAWVDDHWHGGDVHWNEPGHETHQQWNEQPHAPAPQHHQAQPPYQQHGHQAPVVHDAHLLPRHHVPPPPQPPYQQQQQQHGNAAGQRGGHQGW